MRNCLAFIKSMKERLEIDELLNRINVDFCDFDTSIKELCRFNKICLKY